MNSIPRGPIASSEARARVSELVGVDPADSPAVALWVLMRRSVQAAREEAEFPLPKEVVRQAWLRRFGAIDPATGEYRVPAARRGRPIEVGQDEANAFLLERHPELARSPLVFAFLEALYDLDRFEEPTSRFPPPAAWPKDRDGRKRVAERIDTVEKRAARRLSRAVALLNVNR